MGNEPATDVVNAGFWRRWGAYILDSIILSIGLFVIVLLLAIPIAASGVGDGDEIVLFLLYVPFAFGVTALYYALQESSSYQATLGKRALGIKVTDLHGNRISRSRAFARWFAAALSYLTLYIGYLIAAFTDRKQALHDFFADTLVVDRWAYTDTPERQQRHVGFLPILLALLALVFPLAIVLAIAIPAYGDYVTRAKVSSAVNEAAMVQMQIEAHEEQGACLENGSAGIGDPESFASSHVAAIDVGTLQDTGLCGLQITLRDARDQDEAIEGKRVWLEYDAGTAEWTCSSEVEDRYLPSNCRG